MKATTAIGIALGIFLLLAGAQLEGSPLGAFFNIPALLIVMGGTLGATLAGTTFDRMKAIPSLYIRAFKGEQPDMRQRVDELVDFAEQARRQGLLALDGALGQIDDTFMRKGMQLVVDGTDPDLVREILENEIDGMSARHKGGAKPFEKAGGLAPTMGVLGTVMGLVHVLENLDKPETLGPAISGAFIATLYGVGAANMIFLPVSDKLKLLSEAEVELRTMTLEGILAIQAGENPRSIANKLLSFVPPAEREAAAEEGGEAAWSGAPAEVPA